MTLERRKELKKRKFILRMLKQHGLLAEPIDIQRALIERYIDIFNYADRKSLIDKLLQRSDK